jgi:uncharacterized protein YjcR
MTELKAKTLRKRHQPETKELAKRLFLRGWTMPEIEKETSVNINTLYAWRNDLKWDEEHHPNTVEQSLAQRLILLNERDNKTEHEQAELNHLLRNFGTLQKDMAVAKKNNALAEAISKGVMPPVEYVFDEVLAKPAKKLAGIDDKKPKREKKAKNDISGITFEKLDEVREALFFDYQKLWYAIKNDLSLCRNRFILKSRQIGATYYFAFEALDDAIRTGDNQIFLSASRDQAEVFKAYIIAFAKEQFEVELKGAGFILLSNGAELRFLSTNSTTAQSYHGHLYRDEVFWIPNYKKLRKISSGMAAHKKWRTTDFSTPSAISHEAYPVWSGANYNEGKADKDKAEFDISHNALKHGVLGPDKVWRHMVTVEDAEQQGCNLFDIESLRVEYTKDDFDNLFMCKFIDDSQSVFNLQMLLACTIELDEWKDYKPNDQRPFANREVALGYDPSRTRDNASLAVMAVPTPTKDVWRVLAHDTLHGQNFQHQANRIKAVYDSHHVVHIGIDSSGIGQGVYELVESFCYFTMPINYSVQVKTQLVIKAIDVISNGRFQYLAGDNGITRAFLMINRTTTPNGTITYSAGRSNEEGHADIAWSIMHAMAYEPINTNQRKSAVY